MAIGFLLSDGITQVVPDRNLSRQTQPKVLRAEFGDGYEQRIKDGINSLRQNYTVSFVNRPPEEIDEIINFFDELAGATAFKFTIPDKRSEIGETTITVVCESYDLIYTNDIASGCAAQFRRVYE